MISNPRERELDAIDSAGGKGKWGKIGKAMSVAQLVSVIAVGVSLAGVVVPTVLHATAVNNHSAHGASLHSFTIAGITFLYTAKNLAFAVFGGLFGAIVAWAIEYPSILGKARVIALLRRCCRLATSPARTHRDHLPKVRKWLKSAEQN
jgi:hypothetical protein